MLGAIGNFLGRGVGQIAEQVLDSILPKELEFVGDIASAAINLKSGNWLAALNDLQDLMADLPQQLQDLNARFCREEPPPPPCGCRRDGQSPTSNSTNGTTGGPADAPAAADTGPNEASASSGPSARNAQLPQDARDFLALADSNPTEFMRRVRAGDIPASLEGTRGMASMQAAIHEISEMTKLISQLLEAMHRMSDGILSNVRV